VSAAHRTPIVAAMGSRRRARRRVAPRWIVAPSPIVTTGRDLLVGRHLPHHDPFGRAARRHRRALPAVLEEIARALRSGASLPVGLAEVCRTPTDPVRRSLVPVVARMEAGEPATRALAWWRDRRDDPSVGLAVAALVLAGEGGGSRAWAVDQVAATLRDRLGLEDELRAQATQAQLSAVVLVVAPLVFAGLAAVVDPRVVLFLVSDAVGRICLVAGLVLDAAGAWWMTRITGSLR
jgi:tight adherence protein B